MLGEGANEARQQTPSMTALKKYQRLEATGLWRARPEDQRREVIASIGEATLVICDTRDRPLAHWSLAAVARANPGEMPALYHPDGDPGETLELPEGEEGMIGAIETLRGAIARSRPRPGRLRLWGGLGTVAVLGLAALLWLPGAMQRHAAQVLPDIRRQEIGAALLSRLERVGGPACDSAAARPALARLAARTGVRRVAVLPGGVRDSLYLPGGIVVLNRDLVEDHDAPDVAAGYIAVEKARAAAEDPLVALLDASGPFASARLLATGALTPETLDFYAERIATRPRPDLPDEAVLAQFAELNLPSAAYAYARDITGESTLGLIEADPMAGAQPAPVLPDRDWVLLQTICER